MTFDHPNFVIHVWYVYLITLDRKVLIFNFKNMTVMPILSLVYKWDKRIKVHVCNILNLFKDIVEVILMLAKW